LEEFKLFYEKEKQKSKTLNSMIQVQKENFSKLMKEENNRRKHEEDYKAKQKQLEKEKWDDYYGQTQQIYKKFEDKTSKSESATSLIERNGLHFEFAE
jgi:predicted phage tail protein